MLNLENEAFQLYNNVKEGAYIMEYLEKVQLWKNNPNLEPNLKK